MTNRCDQKEDESGLPLDERVERAMKLIEHLLSEMDSYHNHKESMAHAGLLVMVAIAGGILSLKQWPPESITLSMLGLSHYCVTSCGVIILLTLCHLYIRWQLRYRRAAACIYNGALLALAESARRKLKKEDLARCPHQKPSVLRRMVTLLDYVIPIPCAIPEYPIKMRRLPAWLANKIHKEVKWVRVIWSEGLIWVGSVLIWVIVLSRPWTHCCPR
jgi:hypothetical protein